MKMFIIIKSIWNLSELVKNNIIEKLYYQKENY